MSCIKKRCVVIVCSFLDYATWFHKLNIHSTAARGPTGSQLGELIEVFSLYSPGDISVLVICLPRVKKVLSLLRVHNLR